MKKINFDFIFILINFKINYKKIYNYKKIVKKNIIINNDFFIK